MGWRGTASSILLLLLVAAVASAQQQGSRRRSYTVGQVAFKKLEKAHRLLVEEKYQESRAVVDDLARSKGLSAHELALVHQTYGWIASSQEKYGDAISSFEKCLAQDALPTGAQLNTQYNLAQLYMVESRFDRAAASLEDWFTKAEKPGPPAYYLLATAYLQQDENDKAFVPARKSVELSDQPKEAWLQLLLSLYFDRKSYPEAATLLKQLVTRFSKKTYWIQLAAVYGELGEEENSLAVLQIAYLQNLLERDQELRRLARVYLYHQIPYRAAGVVEKGLEEKVIEPDAEAWELLGNSWLSAREYERALAPLESAAKLSEKGEVSVRLGQLYIEREEWGKARKALQQALRKSKLDDRGRALLLLGISNFSSGRIDDAQRAFDQAQQHEKTRKSAGRWLKHLERKRAAN